jgi:CHASE3 domain sensor protein
MERKFKRFLFVSYAVAALLFFGLQYFMKTSLGQVRSYTNLLSHDHEVVVVMQDILTSLQQVEADRRDFIKTHNRDMIQDYNSGVRSVQQSLFYLKQLNASVGYRDDFLDSLQASVNDRIEILKSSIDLAMGNNSSDSAQAVLTGKGKELMDSISGTILELVKERRTSRDDNSRELERVIDNINTLFEVVLVVIVLFGCGLTGATYMYFKKLSSIEDGLRWELFQARQQVQHATSRYQDLKLELKEKIKPAEGGQKEDM